MSAFFGVKRTLLLALRMLFLNLSRLLRTTSAQQSIKLVWNTLSVCGVKGSAICFRVARGNEVS
jgi:hypothetical protein